MKTSIPALCALSCLLAGCSGLGSQAPQRFHVLEVAAAPRPSVTAVGGPSSTMPTLLLVPTSAARFYDTQDIVFCKTDTQCGYYQHNSWTEPPNRRLDALLASRLAQSGSFGAVAVAGSGVRGDVLLAVQLETIYHDATQNPGRANISLVAALIDPQHRVLLSRAHFEGSAPAASYDAAGAVRGFDQALGVLLDEVVDWAGSSVDAMLLRDADTYQSVRWISARTAR